MIGVDKIEDIRRRGRRGEPVASIARAAGVSEPTVRKYLRAGDLSPRPPRPREPEGELLRPFERTVDSWLDDDCRHTATRVYVRLRDEMGYTGSYSTVQRYVRLRLLADGRPRRRRGAPVGRRGPGRRRRLDTVLEECAPRLPPRGPARA